MASVIIVDIICYCANLIAVSSVLIVGIVVLFI